MAKLTDVIPAALHAKESQWLAHLSIEELEARLAKLEAMGKATAAKVAAGSFEARGDTRVHRGRNVAVNKYEVALHSQRGAYAQTLLALRAKRAA